MTLSSNLDILNVSHLASRSLLDHNLVTGAFAQIDSGARHSDIERHAMVFGQYSQLIRADLVGRVAIGHHSIGAHHNRWDRLSLMHQQSDHVVTYERRRNLLVDELVGGETRALIVRSRLGAVAVLETSELVETSNDAFNIRDCW